MVYEAHVEFSGSHVAPRDAAFLCTAGRHRAIVRFSRSLGTPSWLPDAFGLALRLSDLHGPGRHQDFLLVTSIDRPVLHHLLLPVRDAQSRVYSSSLSYRAADDRFLVGALPLRDSPRPPGPTADERLIRAASTGRLRFALAVARHGERFSPIGHLIVGRRLPADRDAIAFDPYNTGGGLELAGALNRLRPSVYAASRTARGCGGAVT